MARALLILLGLLLAVTLVVLGVYGLGRGSGDSGTTTNSVSVEAVR